MRPTEEAANRMHLARLIEPLAMKEGISPSPVEGVQLMRRNTSSPRAPIVYEPNIIIVAQGKKRVYLGDQVHVYDPCNYLVLSVPLPLECETEATPEEPLLGVSVKVDPAVLGELLMETEDIMDVSATVPSIYSTPLTGELADAALRLLECMHSRMDSRILGGQIVREITYRVLCGDQGGTLRALGARHGHFSRIAGILRRMHAEYRETFDVESLAKEVNMSVSAFHHNFKAITSTSPMQYLKSIRLHKARMMMVHDGLNAGTAAYEVGYGSASQFSREFKRFFGAGPADEAAKIRTTAESVSA